MAKVKICGITSKMALAHAVTSGADFVGLVHFKKSPRHLELDAITRLAQVARAHDTVKSVVLLVNPDDALITAVAQNVAPDIIQLHGSETPERVAQIRRIASVAIWKAVAVATVEDVEAARRYLKPGLADLILFDAKPPPSADLPGGNGLCFDWTILKGVSERFEYALAGGLTSENVAEAVQLTHAAIVDVSSGVEAKPGHKDPVLVERFIAAAKVVDQTAP